MQQKLKLLPLFEARTILRRFESPVVSTDTRKTSERERGWEGWERERQETVRQRRREEKSSTVRK